MTQFGNEFKDAQMVCYSFVRKLLLIKYLPGIQHKVGVGFRYWLFHEKLQELHITFFSSRKSAIFILHFANK